MVDYIGYNFYINPFSSHAADVFHLHVYIISATTIYSTTNLDTFHVERYIAWYPWQQNVVNPYCSCVLSENLYPNIYIAIS